MKKVKSQEREEEEVGEGERDLMMKLRRTKEWIGRVAKNSKMQRKKSKEREHQLKQYARPHSKEEEHTE